ncbi:hypothetical protein TNCV_751741 [Trichonephila clavipes]|uniref:Transposase n=1 Tax=Trichonephila clavipes TaxID=2585209 RepID=A0A8X6WBS2_TRICX|nr:hypothetical protein TNCV_751741 [Trichonephila clavipes]
MDKISICSSDLSRSRMKPFLDHLVSGNEKWIVYSVQTRAVSDADCADCDAVGTGFESRKRHGCLSTHKSSRVEVEERWEAPGHTQGFLPLNWGGTEQNRTAACMVLKAKANDSCKNSSP